MHIRASIDLTCSPYQKLFVFFIIFIIATIPTCTGPTQDAWRNQDFSAGYGILKLGDKNTIARFSGGSWGKINGADFDGDGDIDIVATFGTGGNALGTYNGLYVFENIGTAQKGLLDEGFYLVHGEEMPLIGDADKNGTPDLYCNGVLFINQSTKKEIRFSSEKAPAPDWPAPSKFDWNLDGVTDTFPKNLWHLQWVDGKTNKIDIIPVGESELLLDIFIQPFPCDWDADGDTDFLIGQESGHLTFIENENDRFLAEHYVQQKNPFVKSGCLSIPVICDWDGDGDDDLVSGNAAGYFEYFENDNGAFKPVHRLHAGSEEIRVQAGEFGSCQGAIEARWGYVCPEVADWDMDGDLDLLAGCVSGENLFYENIGSRTHPKLAAVQKINIDWGNFAPLYPDGMRYEPKSGDLITQWRCKPVVMDWTEDGLPDYLTIDHLGRLACYPRAKTDAGELVLTPPIYPFVNENNKPLHFCTEEKPGRNGRIKFAFIDWDNDGDKDIIRNGGFEDGKETLDNGCNFAWLENIDEKENEIIFKWRGELMPSDDIHLQGHTDSPFPYDVDGNGTMDIVSGCEDGNVYWFSREWIDGISK
jgi:hypothetical protein